MIDLTPVPAARERAIERVRDREIIIPTFAQMQDPDKIPGEILTRLQNVGLWDLDPLNLFRISWHNDPVESGGGFEKRWFQAGVNVP